MLKSEFHAQLLVQFMEPKPPRVAWVDYAKGVGITLVVVGHVIRGLVSSSLISETPTSRFVDAWIYAFHMPLFFLLSGLFANRQLALTPARYVLDKVSTIAYPYFIWSTIQTLLQLLLGGYTNHSISIDEFADIIVRPVMQFWFLYALFIISLGYYALRRLGVGSMGTLALSIAFYYTQGVLGLIDWPPLHAARVNSPYYAIGSALDRFNFVRRIESLRTSLHMLIAVIGYGIVAYGALFQQASLTLNLLLAISGSGASIAFAVCLSRWRFTDAIRTLGLFSLEIYVAHTIASAGVRILLKSVAGIECATIHLILGVAAGLWGPVAMGWCCRRYGLTGLFRIKLPYRS